jgi:putative ubiquitin-RnfH superfamily antitoxin RatB of RatAB toxin-antitoxin module
MPLDQPVGIYGRRVALDARLVDGDRVEIYRPLRAQPQDARRQRALKAKR